MDPNLSKAIIDFFMGIPLFSRMNSEEVKLVAKHMNVIELQPGETLFEEADRGNFMCFIAHGSLEVIKPTGGGDTITLQLMHSGDMAGILGFVDGVAHSAAIRALTRSHTPAVARPARASSRSPPRRTSCGCNSPGQTGPLRSPKSTGS